MIWSIRKSLARRLVHLRGVEQLEGRDVPAAGWQSLDVLPPSATGATSYIHPDHYRAFDLDPAAMREVLTAAPPDTGWIGTNALTLTLPGPDGTDQHFAVVNAPIMAPELAAQFPEIQTYRGQGLDDPTATLRLDLTPQGLHAQVLAAAGTWYIDPYYHLETGAHISYYRRDLGPLDVYPLYADGSTGPADRGLAEGTANDVASAFDGQLPAPDGYPQALDDWSANFGPSVDGGDGSDGDGPTAGRSGTQLRIYRAAVAATGEYTAFQGGTVALGQAAIVTAMNRVVGVYETELSIRMVLVANNSSLVYTNASTDPYTNNNPNSLLTQNQSNVNAVIGTANYDIGHVFSTAGGGLAGLGVVGGTRKAQGETGTSSPVGDGFTIDYVAHEMGHQFGANHTFNTAFDTGNRNMATAYEPGSGSTIMAYAGLEGSDNLQNNSDPYFNFSSYDEITAYVDNTIPTVGTRTATGNSIPTVSAGDNYVIPAQTPFVLTASGADADGDALTYSWEQRNLGAATNLTTADNGASPLFRVWNPTANPSRTFPRLSNLVANTVPTGEKLPTANWSAAAPMKFRVMVRDNRSGGGGVDEADMTVQVVATGAAFAVTAPNTATTWTGTTSQTVTWNVAGTTATPVSAANVAITLSTDGGLTYPTVLAASVPNNGSATVTVPNISSTSARVRVQAVGNIFFDISNVNFTIARVPVVEGSAVNGGAAQRSKVTSVTVTFDTAVTVGAGAFKLTRVALAGGVAGDNAEITSGGASPQIAVSTTTVGGKTVATLTFTGGGVVEAGSLADGVWRLTVVGSAVTLGGTAMPADYTGPTTGAGRIARLFGDGNGDTTVDFDDLNAFGGAFGTTSSDPSYSPLYDANMDGAVDFDDLNAFGGRFGTTI